MKIINNEWMHEWIDDDIVTCMMRAQPQVEVKSFPAEPIKPLASNHLGTYIVGGALSGDIYLWEVSFIFWWSIIFFNRLVFSWIIGIAYFTLT